MKRSISIGLLAAACAQPALAQENISAIYGRVVSGIDFQNHVPIGPNTTGNLVRVAGSQWGTSLFGLRGYTDIGGGLSSMFVLESGFDVTDGRSGSSLFSRRAYVGLRDNLGSIKLGKDLFLSNDVYWFDPTGQQFIGSATLVRGRNWFNVENAVAYETPPLGGLSVRIQNGFGETPGAWKPNNKAGISVSYTTRHVVGRAIYDVIRDESGKYSSLFASSRDFIAGVAVKLEPVTFFLGYENLQAPDAPAGQPTRAHHYWMGVNYQVLPALTLIGAAFRVNVNEGGGNANLFMLGANYSLSKRTLLYASIGTVRNSGAADFAVEASDNRPLPGQAQMGAYAGVVHLF